MGDHDEYCYEDDYRFHDYENRPADYDSEIESQLDEDEDDDDIENEYYDSFHEDFHSDEAVGYVDYYDNPYND